MMKIKKQLGVSLIELMVAVTLGVVVLAFTIQASSKLYMSSLDNKAKLDIQDTLAYTRHTIGNALKQVYSTPCYFFSDYKKNGIFINGTVGGMNTDDQIFGFYLGRAGSAALNTSATSGRTVPIDINNNIPAVGTGPSQMAPNTDYFIVMMVGHRVTVIGNLAADERTFDVSDLAQSDLGSDSIYFDDTAGNTGMALIATCQENVLFSDVTYASSAGPVAGDNIILSSNKPWGVDFDHRDTFITPITYMLYYIGQDGNGNTGLRSLNLGRPGANSETLVNGIIDMQIIASVEDAVSDNFGFFATTPGISAEGGGTYRTFSSLEEIERIRDLFITYQISSSDAGMFSGGNNSEKVLSFRETYTLRNKDD